MNVLKTTLALSLVLALTRASLADGVVPGHILVKPNPGFSIATIAASYGVRVEDQVPGTTVFSLTLPPRQTEAGFAALLAADVRLAFAETDTYLLNPEVKGDPVHLAFDRVAADPGFVAQWIAPIGVYPPASPLRQVNLGISQTRSIGRGVTVAVLDTGLDPAHPLLRGHFLPGISLINPGSLPLERFDGRTNVAVGHGTMVAGIIARVAPGARILPVRVLNGDGLGTAKTVAKGVMYALQSGARVINFSLGSSVRSRALDEAMDAAQLAGVTCVAAAGNNGSSEKQYPTSRNDVIVVAAVDGGNVKPSFSNFGKAVSVVAPGVGIRSTYLSGGYATWAGTSFAAPYVSAEAALILGVRPTMTNKLVKDVILGTAHSIDRLNPTYKGALGKGLVDIEAAIRLL